MQANSEIECVQCSVLAAEAKDQSKTGFVVRAERNWPAQPRRPPLKPSTARSQVAQFLLGPSVVSARACCA